MPGSMSKPDKVVYCQSLVWAGAHNFSLLITTIFHFWSKHIESRSKIGLENH